MAHPTARLSVFGRQLLVSRVAQGWPASEAAKQLGVSRATAYKWLRRHRDEGCSTGAAARTAHHAAYRTTRWPPSCAPAPGVATDRTVWRR